MYIDEPFSPFSKRLTRLELLLSQAPTEHLTVVIREPFEERDLRQKVGLEHRFPSSISACATQAGYRRVRGQSFELRRSASSPCPITAADRELARPVQPADLAQERSGPAGLPVAMSPAHACPVAKRSDAVHPELDEPQPHARHDHPFVPDADPRVVGSIIDDRHVEEARDRPWFCHDVMAYRSALVTPSNTARAMNRFTLGAFRYRERT